MPWQSVPPLLIITAAFGAIGGGLIGIDYLFLGRVRCQPIIVFLFAEHCTSVDRSFTVQ